MHGVLGYLLSSWLLCKHYRKAQVRGTMEAEQSISIVGRLPRYPATVKSTFNGLIYTTGYAQWLLQLTFWHLQAINSNSLRFGSPYTVKNMQLSGTSSLLQRAQLSFAQGSYFAASHCYTVLILVSFHLPSKIQCCSCICLSWLSPSSLLLHICITIPVWLLFLLAASLLDPRSVADIHGL